MQSVLNSIVQHIPSSNLLLLNDISEFLQQLQTQNQLCDLIVVCQNWPDEFSAEDVNKLVHAAPLARLICCQSLWCESDGRNRDIWPLSLRVSARSAATRIDAEFRILAGLLSAPPVTASRDEMVAFQTGCHVMKTHPLKVTVVTPDLELQNWLIDFLKEIGSTQTTELSQADLVLWDLDPCTPAQLALLKQTLSDQPDMLVCTMLGLALPEDKERLNSLGVRKIINKFNATSELVAFLNEMFSATEQAPKQSRFSA